jgi:hypothetical protein
MNNRHKDGCPMIGFEKTVIFRNPNGPDEQLIINENCIEYVANWWNSFKDPNDVTIQFNFCPCCGIKYE